MADRTRIGLFFVVLFALFGLGVALTWYHLEKWRAPVRTSWKNVNVGDSETKVRDLLGPPIFEYTLENAPADYRVSGYGQPSRGITGKVLIYLKADLVLYVWIDKNGRVEEKFVAVS